ncbi:Cell division protein ZipA [Pseudidiomarina piscicola]|uniref:Cell division protein ZipA n=1 Tax=Pseudidiomarina piscicola TaxID=2614830 RepID=A0A6S6WM30_9GAMM|nr:cell division protein ZipA [Pseudidiomarina piscicola]CAB0150352.1 Cell division protein ZipA [Pseudidiomarina piscicola]VZT39780.1 Cell division protein ZipA [Pseudomonas aeruginosa]
MSTMQIVFSVIGLLLIGLIIGHGMWNIRRSERRARLQQEELDRKREQAQPSAGFDDDGIGEVRVIQRASQRVDKPASESYQKPSAAVESASKQASAKADDGNGVAEPETSRPIRASIDEEELDLPSVAAEPDELKQAQQEEVKAKVKAKPQPRSKPQGKETQTEPAQQSMDLPLDEDEEPVLSQAPDLVIALHVMGTITGPVLLQQMTELGFKYGEFDIFHRHVDTAGQGPVLFSLANMFNPGTFAIEEMDQFESKGVALFLALPIKSNSTQAFTMMHNAAEKLAAAVDGGQVLDENRNPLTRQAVQHIHQSIREYERKRLIRQ